MSELWPILAVVAIWAIVFVFCFGSYVKWLKVPTEMEIEHEHEVHATVEAAAAAAH
ncbi:MAG: hypothetical protein ACHQ4H_07865 [Ktedonobacterales bacterium]